MALSAADLEVLQNVILGLHEPRDVEALREAAPLLFKRAIPADYFIRIEYAPGAASAPDGIASVWDHPARASLAIVRDATRLSHDHPFTEHMIRAASLGPMRLSDFWTRREQLASEYHRRVYQPLGVGRLLVIPLVRGERAGALSLARPFTAPDFSERDREMLRLLAPHLVLAVNAAERATALHAAETEALAGLGLTPRERDVATWLAHGRTNSEIATILQSRPRTVEKHVERILLKLGVENRTAAARVVLGLATAEALASSPGVVRALEAMRRALRPAKAGRRR